MPSSCNSWWQVFCFLLVKQFSAPRDHIKPRTQSSRSFLFWLFFFFNYSEPFRVDSPSITLIYALSFKNYMHVTANSIYSKQAFLRMKCISLLHCCPWDDSCMLPLIYGKEETNLPLYVSKEVFFFCWYGIWCLFHKLLQVIQLPAATWAGFFVCINSSSLKVRCCHQ